MSRLLKSTAVALLAVATARGANAPCATVTDAQCGDGFEKAHDVASALCINDPCETGLPSSADQDLCCRSLRWGPLVSVQVGTSRRQFSETTGTVWITVFGEHGATESMQLQQVSELVDGPIHEWAVGWRSTNVLWYQPSPGTSDLFV